jgi:glycosyltransferase involved in cell wall biosynthesis
MPEPPTLPPIADQPISLVLAAYNDAAYLEEVLDLWVQTLDGLNRAYEILLVDDASADSTAAKAESLAAKYPLLRVLRHETPCGIGAALRTGFGQARNPLLVYTTADRQYQPADLGGLLREIDKVHVTSGYRCWQPVPLALRIAGFVYRILARVVFDLAPASLPGWLGWRDHAYRWLCRAVFGLRLQDLKCFYVLCRREILSQFPLQSDGPFVQTEILAKANFLACLIAEETPVTHVPRGDDGRPPNWWSEGWRVFTRPEFGAVAPAPADSTGVAEVSGC